MMRSSISLVFFFALSIAAAPGFAQDDAGPAAPGDSPEALVQQVLRLYHREDQGTHAASCPTKLMRKVERAWDQISEEDQEKLKPYVLMPGQQKPGDSPSAPGSDEFKFAKTKNFLVFWKTEGPDAVRPGDKNGNGFPDYVEKVGNFLEKAYQKEVVEWGFTKPPTSPQYRVYLKGLNHNGLTHPSTGTQSWIEINSDLEGYTRRTLGDKFGPHVSSDPAGIETGLLKAVCAHEFFHAIQASYSWDQPDWWAEGSAEWVGEMVFPESDFYLNNLPLHLQQPQVSLFSSDLWFEYSASIFTGFLMENLGGPALLRKLWEACKTGRIEAALQSHVGDLRELFTAFWCYTALRAYRDGAKYPLPEAVEVKQYPLQLDSSQISEPQYFGANLFRFKDIPAGKSLQVAVTPKNGSTLGAKLIQIDSATRKWKIVPIKPDAGGVLRATAGQGSQAILVIGNFTRDQAGRYSLRASY